MSVSPSPDHELGELKGQIANYLKTYPADPENIQSVSAFCRQGNEYLAYYVASKFRFYQPENSDQLYSRLPALLGDKSAFGMGYYTHEPFERREGEIILTSPAIAGVKNRGSERFTGIVYEASFFDPTLPRYEYACLLQPTKGISDESYRVEDQLTRTAKGIFQGYNYRYWNFRNATQLPPNSPLVRLLILGFLEDVSKKQAVRSVKSRLAQVAPPDDKFKFIPPPAVQQSAEYLARAIRPTEFHLGYVARVKSIETRIKEQSGIDDKQFGLLKDVAFLRQGDLVAGEFTALLTPLMVAVAEGQWEEAFTGCKFLIKHFSGMFPRWKQVQHEENKSHRSIEHWLSGQGSTERVPGVFQPLFAERDQEIAKREEDKLVKATARAEIWEAMARERVLISKLQVLAIGEVSRKHYMEGPKEVPMFDPNKPLGVNNPITLSYRMSVQHPDLTIPTTDAVFVATLTDNTGRIQRLKGSEGSHYLFKDLELAQYPNTILFNLIYAKEVGPQELSRAYAVLAQKEQIREPETLIALVGKMIEQEVIYLTKQEQVSHPAVARNYHTKIVRLRCFLEEFKEYLGSEN